MKPFCFRYQENVTKAFNFTYINLSKTQEANTVVLELNSTLGWGGRQR